MNWIPYSNQKFDNDKIYLLCYKDFSGKIKYDKTTIKDNKPFIVGNYFVFDMVEKILAYCEIEEYNVLVKYAKDNELK